MSNAVITSGIYCSPAASGTVAGNVTVTIGSGADISPTYAGSTKSGSVQGTVTVILDGADADIGTLSGQGLSAATGTVGKSRLVLKSGTLFTAPKNFAEIDIRVAAGKTMTLSNCELEADSVSSEGTLAFAGVAKLTAEEVLGTVNCAVTGEQVNNHAYVTAPAGSGIVFDAATGITEDNGVWLKKDLENFQGLILTAAQGVTFDLYTGFSGGELVEPYAVDGNSKFYPTVTGRFRYVASGEGLYTVQQNVWMSDEEAMTRTVIDVTPSKRADIGGWEPAESTVVKLFTEEFLEKVVPSDPDLWPDYKHLLVTPAFSGDRAEHLHTTQSEMEAYIASLDDADDDMYVYALTTTPGGRTVPIVIFTRVDLSGAKTLQFKDLGKQITETAFEALAEQGLSYNFYDTRINNLNGTGNRAYAASKGILFFLTESCGAFSGRTAYERRVVSGIVATESILKSVNADAADIKALITAEKQKIIDDGAKYTEDDIIPLKTSDSEHPEFSYELTSINTATGEGRPVTVIPTICDVVERSRVAPTAYVIPAGETWTAKVLELMDLSKISYTYIPAGSKVLLLHVMFGEEDYPISAANKDVNGSGAVDTDDAVYLLLHVMFGAEDYSITA